MSNKKLLQAAAGTAAAGGGSLYAEDVFATICMMEMALIALLLTVLTLRVRVGWFGQK